MNMYAFLVKLLGWATVTAVILLAAGVAQFGSNDCYTTPTMIVCDVAK